MSLGKPQSRQPDLETVLYIYRGLFLDEFDFGRAALIILARSRSALLTSEAQSLQANSL
jgi:hypothetical protein